MFKLFKSKGSDDKSTIIDNIKHNKDVLIVDVRTAKEFAVEHLIGSVNLPLSSVETILPKRVTNLDKVIYFISDDIKRTEVAYRKIRKLGYINVKNIGELKDYPATLIKKQK